ncbi:MAG: hypothetical protein NTY68_01920 [Candidatus Micrarchaeota archaeon]|nr:hypothetical protein [Candidatus Micrarchaeota archaeon]
MREFKQILGDSVKGIIEKFRKRKEDVKRAMQNAKKRQESIEESINHISNAMSEGSFENAEKMAKNLSLSSQDMKKAAIKALVRMIVYHDYERIKAAVKRYGLDDDDQNYAAAKAYAKCMNLRYYGDAILIAEDFGIVDGEKNPAIMLMQRYLRHGMKNEAREIAKRHSLENEFGDMLKSIKAITQPRHR